MPIVLYDLVSYERQSSLSISVSNPMRTFNNYFRKRPTKKDIHECLGPLNLGCSFLFREIYKYEIYKVEITNEAASEFTLERFFNSEARPETTRTLVTSKEIHLPLSY